MFRRYRTKILVLSPPPPNPTTHINKFKKKECYTFYHHTYSMLRVTYRIVKEKIEPVKGLYKLKKWIEDRGLKRAAVTNAPKENAELMISLLGLSDFFQAVILGSDCEHAKPFPDPYLKALELLKVSKEHTCIFEVLSYSSTHPISQLFLLVDFLTTATACSGFCFRNKSWGCGWGKNFWLDD